MDEQHLYDVVSVLKDKLILDINIAGIGGRVEELSTVADNLRNMFLDGQMQSIYDVNITIKTMYKKYLGPEANHHQQETYYKYTPEEIKIMQRPDLPSTQSKHTVIPMTSRSSHVFGVQNLCMKMLLQICTESSNNK